MENPEQRQPKQDETKLRQVRHKVKKDSEVIEKLVEQIVTEYGRELDNEIQKAKSLITRKGQLDDKEIEALVMRVPMFMYFTANGIETVGVQADMAKATKTEVLNQKFAEMEGTIEDKKKFAELESFNEALIEIVFTRAYRKLKTKIEQADNVYTAAKKILDKRIKELEIHKYDRN